jgi:hypothetical protein
LKGLSLRPVDGADSGAAVLGNRYEFGANERKLEAIALEEAGDGAVTLAARLDGVEQRITCGRGEWRKGRMAWGRLAWGELPEQPVAASGAWTASDTFTAKLCFYETPYILTVRLRFIGDELQFNAEANVGFGPTKEPQLTGRAE